jgi:hypothetical protein
MAEIEVVKTEEKTKTEAEIKAEKAKEDYKKAMEAVKAERKAKADKSKEFRKAEITIVWIIFRYMVDLLKKGEPGIKEMFDSAISSLEPTDKLTEKKIADSKEAYKLWLKVITAK